MPHPFNHRQWIGLLPFGLLLAALFFPLVSAAQDDSQLPGPSRTIEETVSYLWGNHYQIPYVTSTAQPGGADITRNILEVTHRDSQTWGGNLIDLYLRKSNSAEPAYNPATGTGTTGAFEAYFVDRTDLNLPWLFRGLRSGNPVWNHLTLNFGGNLNTKNSQYAPQERTILIGPAVLIPLPQHGMMNLSVHYRKEWNHQGITGRDEEYNSGFNIEPVFFVPLRVAGRTIKWNSFVEVNSPKGMSTLGVKMATETLVRSRAVTDLGQLFHKHEKGIDVGMGLEYWNNFSGFPSSTTPGAEELTPFYLITVHLPDGHRR